MTRGPKRIVSEEEQKLFRETLKDAARVKARARIAPKKDAPKEAVRPAARKVPPALEVDAPSIGGHREAHMRRGAIEPESRIDLHGMTQDAAYDSLMRFLERARGQGQRVVLVITGKGDILRAMLPRWLGQKDMRVLVAGASQAHVTHGGAGAFYVALKRKRAA